MSQAIVIEQYGGPDIFKYVNVKDGKPGPGEIAVRHTAVGLNFLDIYHRKGVYPVDSFPAILGTEACGYVEDIGDGVEGLRIGDRVVYGTSKFGAYCERRVIPQSLVCAMPSEVTDEQAAAMFTKGITAHYLLRRAYYLKPGNTILVHAAAGGVGQLLCQWAKFIGATVIATVGSEEKAEIARNNCCDHVIIYTQESVSAKVMEITNGGGVNVVYDSVGKATFDESIKSLGYFGLMVCYGQASGDVGLIDLSILANKSLFLTRSSLFHYKMNRMELILSANELWHLLGKGAIKDNINKRYAFKDIVQAHSDMESRNSVGANVMLLT
jgi:NADPH2:quinone reductase